MSDRYPTYPRTADQLGQVPNLGVLPNLGRVDSLGRLDSLGLYFSPLSLFANGEQGGWYDPSDLTVEMVAWRRNLLTRTEEFDNAAWTKAQVTVTANADVAPDGTLTADKLIATSVFALHEVYHTFTSVAGATYTGSYYVKASEFQYVQLLGPGTVFAEYANFDLQAGTRTAGTTGFGSIESVGNGWYRISLSAVALSASATARISLSIIPAANSPRTGGFTGDDVSGIFVWGAQLELGSSATSYQRITDFNSDFLAAFPTATLYQNAAGTTPVTALGQPVGLVLDKRLGGLSAMGPELFGTGTAVITGTATPATYNTTTGVGTANRVNSTNQSGVNFNPGVTSTYAIRIANTGSATLTIRQGGVTGTAYHTIIPGASAIVYVPATSQVTVTPSSDGSSITFTVSSVREVPGNHLVQTTDASRPTLQARSNLFLQTQALNNAYWTRFGMTVTDNTSDTTDPLGGNTASKVQVSANAREFSGPNQLSVFPIGSTATWSIFAKKGNVSTWPFRVGTASASPNAYNATFNFDTGLFSGTTSGLTVSQEVVGNGWYRLRFTLTIPASTTSVIMQWRAYVDSASGVGDIAYFWGAQAELGSTATTYQRVTTATDYADIGLPRSIQFDGSDDFLRTPVGADINFTATDEMTVCAGVRKLSDANRGTVAHCGDTFTTDQSWGMFAPIASPSIQLGFISRTGGTGRQAQVVNAIYNAPLLGVVTGTNDISASDIRLRFNGAQVNQVTTAQSAANYGTFPLFVGRRSGASDPFNGRINQLIIRNVLTADSTLASLERFVGQKTGLVIP